ncbi:MAG: GNAT family N-acetyltransferase [Polyangiaceae bacterium]
MTSELPGSSTVVRSALPSDYTHFARLFPELGTPDAVPSEARFLAEIMPNALIAEAAGDVVGYTFFQTLNESGYVRHVVVAKKARRAGHARALLTAVRAHLKRSGRTSWSLNVEPNNTAAVSLYQSLGMRFRYASCATRLDWSRARRSTSDDLVVSTFDASEDATIEREFSLPAGQITDHRTKAERVFLKVTGPAGIRAFTVFDRAFPGTYPLRVRDAAAGWKLFEAVHLHARPTDDHIRSVVEQDDAWRDELVSAGAEILLRVAHYEGVL